MKQPRIILIAVIAAIIVCGLFQILTGSSQVSGSAAPAEESTFDRIVRTGKIRCGHWNWEPLFYHDLKSGELHGIFYDVMQEFTRISGIEVEWTHEVQYANLISDLETRKVDAICAGVWPSALRGKRILFSQPVFYLPINAYVREGDTRFDHNIGAINDPVVKVASMDGEMSQEIRKMLFPNSADYSIPQLVGSGTEMLLNIANGKADVTFTDGFTGMEYMKANPGKIRVVENDFPIRMMPNALTVNDDDERLLMLLDEALQQLHNSGTIEKILKKYDAAYPGVLYRVAPAYQPPKKEG